MGAYDTRYEVEALRRAIAIAHKKEFPEYVQAIKARASVTPEMKAKAIVEAQELRDLTKQEKVTKRQEDICRLLDESELVKNPSNGNTMCRYPIYTITSPHVVDKTIVTEDLDEMNDETPTFQYRGLFNETGALGKEKVLAMMEKLANPQVPM